MNDIHTCPICFEVPDLPVSINISRTEKCPFIEKNLVCLRCITQMIYFNKSIKMKCLCNSHSIDISNTFYMCYGDLYHFSDDFVEKKLWNSLYHKNKKCNSCYRKFNNIEQLYDHYKYYGNTCIPINKKKIMLLVLIFILNFLGQLILYYYLNFCTYQNFFCNYCQEYYKEYSTFIITNYYLTINIFLENVFSLLSEEKIIWYDIYQAFNFFNILFFTICIYTKTDTPNDFELFSMVKELIKDSFWIKIGFKIYQSSNK